MYKCLLIRREKGVNSFPVSYIKDLRSLQKSVNKTLKYIQCVLCRLVIYIVIFCGDISFKIDNSYIQDVKYLYSCI